MSESNFRQQVIKELKKYGQDAIAVENSARPGTPDVNCLRGWIELKYLPAWPKKEDTNVEIEHFTPQQRNFLRRRWEAGGGAWLYLRVGSRGKIENLLFRGPEAADYVGLVPRSRLEQLSSLHTYGKVNGQELIEALHR